MLGTGRRFRRVAVLGAAAGGLTVLSWLPFPLAGRTLPQPPPTRARQVPIALGRALAGAPRGAVRVEGGGVEVRRAVRAGALACPGIRFTALALTWQQSGTGRVGVAARVGSGPAALGPARPLGLDQDGPDPGSREDHPGQRATELLWVGGARCVDLHLALPPGVRISGLRAAFADTSGVAPEEAAPSGSGLLGVTAAQAYAWRPTIISRAGWGANEKLRNCGPSYAPRVKMAFVHHTANANSYSPSQSDDLMRAIYWYHTQVLGWCDIAYNFLVDRYGRIFEGRAGGVTLPVISAATRGFNTGSVSVAAIGNFARARPPTAMVAAIERVLAWRLDIAHVNPVASVWMRAASSSTGGKFPEGTWVKFRTIAGHRDAGYTECPGDYLYAQLPSIRSAVYARGLPKIFNPNQSAASVQSGAGPVSWRAVGSTSMRWVLRVLDPGGTVVFSESESGSTFSTSWDGQTSGGPAPPGDYRIRISAQTSSAYARPATFHLTVIPAPSPTPSPSPSSESGP